MTWASDEEAAWHLRFEIFLGDPTSDNSAYTTYQYEIAVQQAAAELRLVEIESRLTDREMPSCPITSESGWPARRYNQLSWIRLAWSRRDEPLVAAPALAW